MVEPGPDAARVGALQSALGHVFADGELLQRALTHASFVNEHGGSASGQVIADNERLEFLGDAVLQLTVSEWLFERFPEVSEGHLTQRRSVIVNAHVLAEVGGSLELGALLRVGVGEERSGGRSRPSNLADALEALLGAVFLDGGFKAARRVVKQLFGGRLERVATEPAKGPKSRLQEWAQATHHVTPSYTHVGMTGPAHAACFVAEVTILDVVQVKGEGSSKKDAEKAAARQALTQIGLD